MIAPEILALARRARDHSPETVRVIVWPESLCVRAQYGIHFREESRCWDLVTEQWLDEVVDRVVADLRSDRLRSER